MSITYPLALPTSIGIAEITLTANNAVATSQSPFTFQQQIIQHPGQRWTASISIPPVRRDLAEPWVAFLLALNGPVGTFLLGDPNGKEPQGAIKDASNWFLAGGSWNLLGLWNDSVGYDYNPSGDMFANPLVNGNQATRSPTLSIKGLEPLVTDIFVAGDYVQLGSGTTATLHKVLQNVSSNGSGEAVLDIWPQTRRAVVDNEPVLYKNTVGKFRLSNAQQSFNINDASIYGISFDCVEAI